MQRDGLVRCIPDPADRRRTRVVLTQRARQLQGDLSATARAVNAAATRGLSDQEVAEFMRITATLIRNLETETARPAPAPVPASGSPERRHRRRDGRRQPSG